VPSLEIFVSYSTKEKAIAAKVGIPKMKALERSTFLR
jgi:hypothetical protein